MKKISIYLILFLFIALTLRIWGLNNVPPELFGDELDVGYQSYSLLKTGKDYYGQTLPTYIHSFSEWRAPFLMYVTSVFIGVFGLNEWGIRLPSAVFGVATIYLLMKVLEEIIDQDRSSDGNINDKKLVDNKMAVSIAAGIFLTLNPWHLQYSRAAFEVSLLLFLILLGVYLFIQSFKKSWLIILSSLAFSLTFYTYSTANVFTPLLILLLICVYKKDLLKINIKTLAFSVIIFIICMLPISYNVLFGHASDRFSQFSIFSDETILTEINQKRMEASGSYIDKIFYNRPVFWTKRIISNYVTAFSPQFLFISGDITYRHSIHFVGEFYWIMLPLIILGLYSVAGLRGKKKYLLLGWLFIAPIPSALTKDGAYHATRLILMLPPLTYLAALGFNYLFDLNIGKRLKKMIIFFVSFVIIIEMGNYLNEYWVHYPKESWRWWQTGYRESMKYMHDNEDKYSKIIFNNTYEPALLRFLVWWNYPPNKFLTDFVSDKPQENILPGFSGFVLGDKYYFGTAKDYPGGVIGFVKPGELYLVSQRDEVGGDWDWEVNSPDNIEVLKTVRNPYNEPIFYVVTGKIK